MHNQLDEFYRQILNVGFFALREASALGDLDWVKAEVELLHNVPSLISEDNQQRHEYFWKHERGHYIEWVSRGDRAVQKARMETFYEPIWCEMRPLIQKTE